MKISTLAWLSALTSIGFASAAAPPGKSGPKYYFPREIKRQVGPFLNTTAPTSTSTSLSSRDTSSDTVIVGGAVSVSAGGDLTASTTTDTSTAQSPTTVGTPTTTPDPNTAIDTSTDTSTG